MARQEMPIFTRTFDFLTWLLPMTNHFPRVHRFLDDLFQLLPLTSRHDRQFGAHTATAAQIIRAILPIRVL
jgi:hypothetical protein